MKRIALACLVALFTLTGASSALAQGGSDLFQQALRKERVDGDLKAAITLYQRILKEQGADRALCAKTLVQLGQAYEKMGDADARSSYQRVIREYADQSEQVTVARARLGALAAGGTAATNGSTMSVRRILEGTTYLSGQVSPDGRLLSFTDWRSNGNIGIHDLATGQDRVLTKSTDPDGSGVQGFGEYSVPSPDGKSVAYAWYIKDGSPSLSVVGLDGSKPRVLQTAGNGVLYHVPLAWSPDSRHLLVEYVKAEGNRDMMLVTVADGSARLLKATGKEPSPGGVFSPDGRYIAWATREGVALFDVRKGTESPLIPDQSRHSVLGWAPDGRHILFSSERSGSADAWLIAVTDGKAQGEPIFVKKNWGSMPMGIARSGAFFYAVNNSSAALQVAELDPANGNVVSPPQTAARQGNTGSPDWSPDGSRLAYILRGTPSRTVIVHAMDTGEERELPVGDWTIKGGLRWMPDGKAVVVRAVHPAQGENLIGVDVQTGQVTTLMPAPTDVLRFDPHPDGNTIFYVKTSAFPNLSGTRILARNLRSGDETEIVRMSGLRAVVVSPDGRRLLAMGSDGESQVLLVVPVAGGEVRELLRVSGKEGPNWGGVLSWTPDGRHVTYMKGLISGKNFRWQLWRVAAQGGEPQQLGLITGGGLLGLRLHPDGRRVAIAEMKTNLEVWVMENFLPKAEAPAKARQH